MPKSPNSKRRVLLIDDDEQFAARLRSRLAKDYEVGFEPTGAAGLEALDSFNPDLVLLDIVLGSDQDGIDFLPKIQGRPLPPPVIMLTGIRDHRTVVRALKAGALDYETKPVDIPLLESAMERALEYHDQRRRIHLLIEERDADLPRLIAVSDGLRDVFNLAQNAAQTDVTILLTGESGVGKSAIARQLRTWSSRREHAFRERSCAEFSDSLVEDELFGHEPGAFNGATQMRRGVFELADGGTVFLDEIGEASPLVQAKLLRLLDTGTFTRLGGEKELRTDVRIIAATNRDLEKMVQEGRFRGDLRNRLRGIRIRIPPLRERRTDILPLAEHCREKYAVRYKKPVQAFSPGAKALLERQPWPGNVWEMERLVDAAVSLCEGEILQSADIMRAQGREECVDLTLPQARARARLRCDEAYIRGRLRESQCDVKEAAALSGVSEQYFRRILKQYAIDPGEYRATTLSREREGQRPSACAVR